MKNKKSEDTVYEKLKNAIRKRYIKKGSKLVETTLAEKMGVSRTPVRSAIRRLESEGLVYSIANRGAFVITPTKTEIEQTFQVRAALECMAIEAAIARATSEQIKELQELLISENEILCERRMDEYFAINNEIHLKIADMAGNTVLYNYINDLLERCGLYLVLYDPFSRLEYCPTAEHEKIFAAIQNRDARAARPTMEEHLQSSIANLHVAEEIPEDYIAL